MNGSRGNSWRFFHLLSAALLLALLASPGLAQGGQGGDEGAAPSFTHAIHQNGGIECAVCHLSGGAEELTTPTQQTCSNCHGESEVTAPPPAAPKAHEWLFPHEEHASAVSDCTTCHDAEKPVLAAKLKMSDCIACHQETGFELGCEDCHTRFDADTPPGPGTTPLLDHSLTWEQRHGEISKIVDDQCAFCHRVPQDCNSCHLDRPPRSHTRLWKVNTHGREAEVDRQRCQACHQDQSFCIECHQDTQPLSHTPIWGELGNQHCLSCHLPLSDTACSTCHDNLALHDTVLPASHIPTWGQPANQHCNSCHLPLADTTCVLCHKTLEAHYTEAPANTHVGGWGQPANQHCNTCHLPLEDNDCAVCHTTLDAHYNQAPANTHVGGWGEPTNNHCQSCHLPLSDTDCATCHVGTPSHESAPAFHRGSFGPPVNDHCNSCHLPLADTSCAVCHTQGDLQKHQNAPPPATHDVTWGGRLNRHCQSCHLPLSDNICAVCHQDLAAHDSPPPSHSDPYWNRTPTVNHCNNCHLPVIDESCGVCHRRDDHFSAPTMPETHDPNTDCLYCHPAARPTNHPLTDLESCLRCHKLP